VSLRTAVHAEWTKLRTVPGPAWLLLGVVVATVSVGAAAAASGGCRVGSCAVDPARLSLTGVSLGQAVVAALAVLAVGGEYGTGMIRVTLAAVPRRGTMLAAKAVVITAVVLPAAALAVVASLWAGPVGLSAAVVRAAVGSVLYLALIALLSLGAAAAVRDSTSAIGLVLGLLYVLPIIASAVHDQHWRRHLLQIAPMPAGQAVQATVDLADLPIGPWAGLGVLAAWAAGALLIGALVLHRRDA
jgi:ABC-2 type transport system permease protein